jgi:hypothetical protein
MCVINIRKVIKPRRQQWCCDCGRAITKPCLRLYGSAHKGEHPYHIWICVECAQKAHDKRVLEAAAILVAGHLKTLL